MPDLSVSVKHINDDTTWLLSISHPAPGTIDTFKTVNLLIDPWLISWDIAYHPLFSRQRHSKPSCVESIQALEDQLPEGQSVDVIIINHDFNDHCHRETLLTARRDIPVFAHPVALSKLRSWAIFENVQSLPIFQDKTGKADQVVLYPVSTGAGEGGEADALRVVATYLPSKGFEPLGIRLHGALMLTIHSAYIQNPYYIVYCPHGISPPSLDPWIHAHQNAECLALFHGFDEVDNPWYLAGKLNLGIRTAPTLCKTIRPRLWIRTHDELKEAYGLIAKTLRRRPVETESCISALESQGIDSTQVVIVPNGETIKVL